jgi:hypothetical protein
MGFANHLGCASHVIVMRLAIEENLDIAPAETKRFNACTYLRRRASKVCVDEDIALRGHDEIAGKVLASDVEEAVSNPERGDRCCPGGICLRMKAYGRAKQNEQ